jgi:hypothetical protein
MNDPADDLQRQMWKIVLANNVALDASCEFELRRMVERAAQKMLSAEQGGRIHEAQENLQKILSEMKTDAAARRVNQLDLSSLRRALAALCPIWPFCE